MNEPIVDYTGLEKLINVQCHCFHEDG